MARDSSLHVATWIVLILATVVCAFTLRLIRESSPRLAGAQPADLTPATASRVVDGDTIEVSPPIEGTEDVRPHSRTYPAAGER